MGSDMRVDEAVDVHTWEHDVGDTLEEAIKSLGLAEQLIMFGPVKVHPEYRQAVWAVVNSIAENLTDDFRERLLSGMVGQHLGSVDI